MRSIKSLILEYELAHYEGRLEKLIGLDAPDIVLDEEVKVIQELKNGVVHIIGNKALLNEKSKFYKIRKNKGGNFYLQFDKGIKYFGRTDYKVSYIVR